MFIGFMIGLSPEPAEAKAEDGDQHGWARRLA
jgi:hypothetical protein